MKKNESGDAARTTKSPNVPTPDEARDWLKRSGEMPDLSVTWETAPVEEPAVMNAILDILFRPRATPDAA